VLDINLEGHYTIPKYYRKKGYINSKMIKGTRDEICKEPARVFP